MNKIVFTNGCFDLIHPGHIELLEKARRMGTKLIVGINSDASVRKIKGEAKPVQNEHDRAAVLRGLRAVDEVRIFDELTPENLIREIKPDVLVKGGDWKENEIIGGDFVKKNGGKVLSIPLKQGFSSTGIIERISSGKQAETYLGRLKPETFDSPAISSLNEHLEVFQKILTRHLDVINECADLICETLSKGKKILLCGNGGSAADAQHLAAEFVGRYETERRAYPAIALTTDTSALTALANDYNFEKVFARQIEALATEGDCLIALSTSGNSPNVIEAVMQARKTGCRVIGMTGAKGKKLASLSDACIMIPSERTARIQEAHITIGHIWCEIFDRKVELQQI